SPSAGTAPTSSASRRCAAGSPPPPRRPAPRRPMKSRRRFRLFGAAAAVVLLALGVGAWNTLLRPVPVHYEDDTENFKYGTIGVEESSGIPYWIWVVLPRVFPEYLP